MFKFASLLAIASLSQAISLNQGPDGDRPDCPDRPERPERPDRPPRGKGGALGKAFDIFDLNEDGVLQRDELESTLTEMGVSETMTNAWLKVYDGPEDPDAEADDAETEENRIEKKDFA